MKKNAMELMNNHKTAFADIVTGEYVTMEYLSNNGVYINVINKYVPFIQAYQAASDGTLTKTNLSQQVKYYTVAHF